MYAYVRDRAWLRCTEWKALDCVTISLLGVLCRIEYRNFHNC